MEVCTGTLKRGVLITGTIRNRGGGGVKNYLVSGTVVAQFCGYIYISIDGT